MSKIVTITLAKNEDRAIESFVRYNAQIVERMIIIDNGSNDETISIIKKLILEGYKIELYSEANVGYKQAYLENKYIYKALSEGDEDWVIPLDVDEYIDMNQNALDELDRDKGYYVYWNNYVLSPDSCENEVCIPRKLVTRLEPKEDTGNIEKITKVILPREFIETNSAYVSCGHHGLINGGVKNLILLDQIKIAHFPIISKEQLIMKIYGKYLSYIPNELRGRNGVHVNRYVEALKNGSICLESLLAGEYTVGEGKLSLFNKKYDPLRPCYVKSIQMKYTSDKPIDVNEFFLGIAEEFALKYAISKKHSEKSNNERIIVFGTGETAKCLFEQVEDEGIEVVAYVDSDPNIEYMRFYKELIITPDKIRLFDYDYILIASVDKYEEIESILLEVGVLQEKIVGIQYLYNKMNLIG